MDKREKLASMEKMIRELEDLKNSETSVLKKIAQIEAENINTGVQLLDQKLPDIHESIDQSIEHIDAILTEFTAYKDKFVTDNKLDVAEPAP